MATRSAFYSKMMPSPKKTANDFHGGLVYIVICVIFYEVFKMHSFYKKSCLLGLALMLAAPPMAYAAEDGNERKRGIIKRMMAQKRESANNPDGSKKGFYVKGKGQSHNETLMDRDFIVYTPPKLPKHGDVPLLVVLHGGFGNAAHIQNYIGLDAMADKGGFIVAYLNGTKVARGLPEKMQGWNAGGCCGQPEAKQVDDVGFISRVIGFIAQKYGADINRVYGTGHSNGGMMTQRIICETDLYQNGVSISGTLQMDRQSCPNARGNVMVNIHGAQDENLPIEGGHTEKGFNKKTDYKSQAYARSVFESSGARYDLILLQGADHSPETINAKLWETENMSLPHKIVRTLGLLE